MAVTVVGEDPAVYKQCTCKFCASILRYTPMDVGDHIESDFAGGRDIVKVIICPKCSKKVQV